MTVEIRELVVKVTLEDPRGDKPGQSQGDSRPEADLVEACVEQVLEILRQKGER